MVLFKLNLVFWTADKMFSYSEQKYYHRYANNCALSSFDGMEGFLRKLKIFYDVNFCINNLSYIWICQHSLIGVELLKALHRFYMYILSYLSYFTLCILAFYIMYSSATLKLEWGCYMSPDCNLYASCQTLSHIFIRPKYLKLRF